MFQHFIVKLCIRFLQTQNKRIIFFTFGIKYRKSASFFRGCYRCPVSLNGNGFVDLYRKCRSFITAVA